MSFGTTKRFYVTVCILKGIIELLLFHLLDKTTTNNHGFITISCNARITPHFLELSLPYIKLVVGVVLRYS